MVARVAGKGSLEFRADEHPNRFAALEQRVRAEAASVIVANCRQRSSNRMPAGFRILPMVPSGKQRRSGLSVSIGPIRICPLHQSRPLQSEIGPRNLSMAYFGLQWAIVACFRYACLDGRHSGQLPQRRNAIPIRIARRGLCRALRFAPCPPSLSICGRPWTG